MQLSLAVLVFYRSWVVFSLGGCFPPIFPSHCQGQVLCLQHDLGPVQPTWVSHSVPCLSRQVRPDGSRVACAEGEPHISITFRRRIRFGPSRFRSPLLTGSQLISLPAGTQMFPSPAFAILADRQDALRQSWQVLTHSEIPGSMAACSSPGLIAACHVLHRHPSQVIHHTASVRMDEYYIPADACANPMHGLIAGPPNGWPAGPSHPIRRPDVASFTGRALLDTTSLQCAIVLPEFVN